MCGGQWFHGKWEERGAESALSSMGFYIRQFFLIIGNVNQKLEAANMVIKNMIFIKSAIVIISLFGLFRRTTQVSQEDYYENQ